MKSMLDNLEGCPLHRRTPFGISPVRRTQFSVARFYGGVTFQGESYTYFPKTDELIRNDVLKWKRKRAKKSGMLILEKKS